VDGAGIQSGDDFIAWIKNGLTISDITILVITPNYFASKFCMAEMGAVWALDRRVFPIVIPNISRDAGVVMLGRQTAQINDSGLDELRDKIAEFFPNAGKNTPRWSAQKQLFLADLSVILAKLPQPNLIDRAALTKEQEKNEAFVQMLQESEMRSAEQRGYIEKLEQLKDQEAVDEIKLSSLPSGEQYIALLESVKEEVSGYSAVEIRCLYALFTDDWWFPGDDIWRERGNEIDTALKSNWIHQRSDERGYRANRSHPRYQSAIVAIEKLWDHIGEMDKKLKRIVEEREKYEIDIQNLEYWARQFGSLFY
jgi:hypothetical protein